MKKKVIACLLTVSMVAALFTGCGSGAGKKDDTAKGEGNSTAVTDTAVGDEDYPVIKVVYCYGFPPTDEQAIEEKLNKIAREKAHAEIDLVGIEFGNWSTQLNLILTGGGDGAVDLFNSFWYTPVANLVANGQVMELDDLIKKEGTGITSLFSGELADFMKGGQVNGKQYGIPCMYAYCTENLYYAKKENVEKAGIDWSKVNNLDTMSDAILKIKKANPDKSFIPGSTDPYWIPKSIDYLGDSNFLGVLMDPTNSTKIENYYESDYFLNFLNYVKVWKENNVFSPDPLSNNGSTLNNLLMGVTNGTTGYAWDTKVGMATTEAQNNMELEGTNVTEALSTTSDVTTYMWHISTFSKNPEAAMRVLNLLYTDPEASQLVANGVEGLDYEMNADGQMEYPEGKKGLADLGWSVGSMAYWPNVMLCKTWYYEPKDVYTKMLEKNKTCKKSLALGFTFDSTNVANQITACTNVVAQYYAPLMYGEVDIDSTLPDFQKALKKAGIEEIIAEKQKQLDAWLAGNK